MADYLLDTNVILRLHDGASPDQAIAQQAVLKLRLHRHRVCLTAQNLTEFWAVVTRPVTANGFGWDTTKAKLEVEQMIRRFPLLEETPAIFPNWLTLVSARQIKGKRAHDVRLLAVMQAHQITHLLTFNVADFGGFPNFTVLHPSSIR